MRHAFCGAKVAPSCVVRSNQPLSMMEINQKKAINVFNSSAGSCLVEIRYFVENGGNLSIKDEKSGWTLLHFCAECQQPEVMNYLIDSGANVNIQDSQGWAPLHLSIDSEIDGAIQSETEIHFVLTKMLINRGANLDLKTNEGETPRDIAKAYGVEILNKFDNLVIG